MAVLDQHEPDTAFLLRDSCSDAHVTRTITEHDGGSQWALKVSAWGLVVLLSCSCSSLESGRYLVAHSADDVKPLPHDVWRTYGLSPRGAGAPRHMTVEDSVGRKRPMVFERRFDDDLSYVFYPIIVRERLLLFGPALLTVLPVWFLDRGEGGGEVARRIVSITWLGNVSKVERISVRRYASGEWADSRRRVFSLSYKHMECEYEFDESLTDECVVVLDYDNGEKTVIVPLSYTRGFEWTPYIKMINAPKYPTTYPGLRPQLPPEGGKGSASQ